MSTHAPHAARHTSPYLLSASQLVFNIGFYAVVPFLAIYLRDDMLLSGGLIGTIIGLRTFSQQGMFLLGGALSDRYGARAIILCGCVVRITGYLLLALGGSLWAVVLGACLTGVGGALFSPSIESLLAQAGTRSEAEGRRSRAEWFALFAVCGELGAVLGPVLGSLMAGFGFKTMALAGAGVFIVALVALFILLPRTPHRDGPLQIVPWWQTFHQPRFVAFILAYSAYLYSYNQLYLALPVELRRSGSSDAALGPLFILASLLIITLQLPLAPFRGGTYVTARFRAAGGLVCQRGAVCPAPAFRGLAAAVACSMHGDAPDAGSDDYRSGGDGSGSAFRRGP